jgi:hypothetical protein
VIKIFLETIRVAERNQRNKQNIAHAHWNSADPLSLTPENTSGMDQGRTKQAWLLAFAERCRNFGLDEFVPVPTPDRMDIGPFQTPEKTEGIASIIVNVSRNSVQ